MVVLGLEGDRMERVARDLPVEAHSYEVDVTDDNAALAVTVVSPTYSRAVIRR
ncbi:hypothetical protein [Streptomyces sp. NPDC054854]